MIARAASGASPALGLGKAEEIVVLPKTDFSVAATAGLIRNTKLAVGVDATGWKSAQIVTLFHRIDTPWQGTGTGQLLVNGIAIAPEDPSLLFSMGFLARSLTFGASTLAGSMDITTVPAPIPSLLEVALQWTQGPTAVTTIPNSFALSVRLVGRQR